jgi:hypothetical protein
LSGTERDGNNRQQYHRDLDEASGGLRRAYRCTDAPNEENHDQGSVI